MPDPAENPYQPQFCMRLDSLSNLPPLSLPDGYSIRHYREGDGAHWDRIIGESFLVPEDQRQRRFEQIMAGDAAFLPERVFFVMHGDEPVGTASAWQVRDCPPHIGYLHYVGVLPSEAGKGLGLQVSLAALHKMAAEGRTAAVLRTDDYRIPAVKTYLRLGFRPVLVHENQRARWLAAFEKMGRPELIERFASIINGPVTDPCGF